MQKQGLKVLFWCHLAQSECILDFLKSGEWSKTELGGSWCWR